MIENITIL